MQRLAKKLKINGKPVQMVGSQMLIDFSDFDLGVPLDLTPKKKRVQKCECGAQAIGIKNFMVGHAEYCPVSENKTPLER